MNLVELQWRQFDCKVSSAGRPQRLTRRSTRAAVLEQGGGDWFAGLIADFAREVFAPALTRPRGADEPPISVMKGMSTRRHANTVRRSEADN